MGSLDVDSLFTNIPFEETNGICTNKLLKESETVEDFRLWALRIHILFLMGHLMSKSIVWSWVIPWDLH